MKRMNLDTTWKNCLHAWNIIVKYRELKSHKNVSISRLKQLALPEEHKNIMLGCYFCEYATKAKERWEAKQRRMLKKHKFRVMCEFCPGSKIDPEFNCIDDEYDYDHQPLKFYAKLKELSKIRQQPKKRRRTKC